MNPGQTYAPLPPAGHQYGWADSETPLGIPGPDSPPGVRVTGPFGVRPHLTRLPNDVVVLTSGRVGLHMWLAQYTEPADFERPSTIPWADFNLAVHHNRYFGHDPQRRFAAPFVNSSDGQGAHESTSCERPLHPFAGWLVCVRLTEFACRRGDDCVAGHKLGSVDL